MIPWHDRRAHERTPIKGHVVVTTPHGSVTRQLVDISRGGISFEADRPELLGELVRVRFALPRGERTTLVDPDALVVRAEPHLGSCVMGLRFLELYAAWGRLIAGYVVACSEGRVQHRGSSPHPSSCEQRAPSAIRARTTEVHDHGRIEGRAVRELYRAAIRQLESTLAKR